MRLAGASQNHLSGRCVPARSIFIPGFKTTGTWLSSHGGRSIRLWHLDIVPECRTVASVLWRCRDLPSNCARTTGAPTSPYQNNIDHYRRDFASRNYLMRRVSSFARSDRTLLSFLAPRQIFTGAVRWGASPLAFDFDLPHGAAASISSSARSCHIVTTFTIVRSTARSSCAHEPLADYANTAGSLAHRRLERIPFACALKLGRPRSC